MTTVKSMSMRLPLLFVIDSVLKYSYWDFTQHMQTKHSPLDVNDDDFMANVSHNFTPKESIPDEEETTLEDLQTVLQNASSSILELCLMGAFGLCQCAVVGMSLLVLFCQLRTVKKFYRCVLGIVALLMSRKCSNIATRKLSEEQDASSSAFGWSTLLVYGLAQLIFVMIYDYLSVTDVRAYVSANLKLDSKASDKLRYGSDVVMAIAFTAPIIFGTSDVYLPVSIFLWLAWLVPVFVQTLHTMTFACTLCKLIIPCVHYAKRQVRAVGFDVFCMNVMESVRLGSLLRIFFFLRLAYHIVMSKALSENLADSNMLNDLVLEMLHDMCGTLLAVISLASVISTLSGWALYLTYRLMGANDEEESLQPAVSGFLFVLLAMQTGMTAMAPSSRLQLLAQNCILLLVANQHFVQGVAADMVLKASTDEVPVSKHLRPMLPYLLIFTFPFLVVLQLWDYSFRLSWLLAVSTFTLELVLKSVTTLVIYILNMVHSRTNYLQENLEDLVFYIKGFCGCLEFICGVFLFINGAYIFFFESGGFIRLTMMIVHFYSNIYRAALKGWSSFKLYRSAWVKVSGLRTANQEELDQHADICPICYQDMSEAVVIHCSHVFHKACLLRWMTIQEKCPLCHAAI